MHTALVQLLPLPVMSGLFPLSSRYSSVQEVYTEPLNPMWFSESRSTSVSAMIILGYNPSSLTPPLPLSFPLSFFIFISLSHCPKIVEVKHGYCLCPQCLA